MANGVTTMDDLLSEDKHLDYSWCGSPSNETRTAAWSTLPRSHREEWRSLELEGTLWLEVYRRQRGDAAAGRFLQAIDEAGIGYAGNAPSAGLSGWELAIERVQAYCPSRRP